MSGQQETAIAPGSESAAIDIVDRAYGEDHLRDCMGYKSFGEWPCNCIIGDLCDEVERLRVLLADAYARTSEGVDDEAQVRTGPLLGQPERLLDDGAVADRGPLLVPTDGGSRRSTPHAGDAERHVVRGASGHSIAAPTKRPAEPDKNGSDAGVSS